MVRSRGMLQLTTLILASAILLSCSAPWSANSVEVEITDGRILPRPESVTGGNKSVAFRVTNKGSEPHQFLILQTDTPADELPLEGDRVDLRMLTI